MDSTPRSNGEEILDHKRSEGPTKIGTALCLEEVLLESISEQGGLPFVISGSG